MSGAFLYLTWCSTWNLLRLRVLRLRQPRYLIGTIVGGLYFYFAVYRSGRPSTGASHGPLAFIARHQSTIELVASAVLFAIVALAWVWPRSGRPALAFSRAEIQFLFPAPITRRQLIQYKLLRWVLATPLGTAIVTFFFRPSSAAHGWSFFFAVSIFMTTLNLHMTGVSLSRENLGKHGLAGLTRQWLPLTLVVAAVLILGGTVAADWGHLSSLQRPADIFGELEQLSASGLPAIVLWPFRALVRLPLAISGTELFRALPAAALLLVVNFLWVVNSDASFEEASAERAEQLAHQARRTTPVMYRARSAPFTLSLAGPPETAFLWKNLILMGRYSFRQIIVRLLPLVMMLGIVFIAGTGREAIGQTIAWVSLFGATFATLLGPHMVRNDLRQDLARLAILKTWPVRGVALVRGEILAPLVVLSAVAWLLLASATVFSGPVLLDLTGSTSGQLLGAFALMLIAPSIIAMQLVALNGLAVLFPAWVSIGPSRSSGLEAFGQRLLMMVGLLILIVVAALPAIAIGGMVGFAIRLATGIVSVVLPVAVASAVLFAECLLATEVIGRVFDRTSIGDVDAGE